MKKLRIPLRNVDEKTIYHECANSFTDKTALSYIEDVVSSAAVYETHVPRDIARFPRYTIEEEDKEKIIKVYTEKFAKRDTVGYKYYEAIMTNANGRCPICGCGKVKTLDHFLPKTTYPLVCVTPANLVPTCRDCNFDKRSFWGADYYSIPFNPYFDVMDDKWLECEFTIYRDNTFAVVYKNGYDKKKNEKLWEKYETHFKVFDLNATFSARAGEEIENCKGKYKKLLYECGIEDVRKDLIDNRDSFEQIDINSWRSALYRELVNKVHDYCEWLATSD